jgi:HlyD family secretion protein
MKSAQIVQLPAPATKLPPPPVSARRNALATAANWLTTTLTALAGRIWHWKWHGLAFAASLLLALYFGPNAIFGPSVPVDVAVRGTFLQTVVASGHVEAPFRVNISTQVTAVVANIPVIEGQVVKAGATLIKLDDRELQAVVVAGEGAVAQAQARLRQMRELTLPAAQQSLKQAQATLLNAQRAYDRTLKLHKDGYSTTVALDETIRALDVAKAQFKSTELQIATSQMGGSDYSMAESQLRRALDLKERRNWQHGFASHGVDGSFT